MEKRPTLVPTRSCIAIAVVTLESLVHKRKRQARDRSTQEHSACVSAVYAPREWAFWAESLGVLALFALNGFPGCFCRRIIRCFHRSSGEKIRTSHQPR